MIIEAITKKIGKLLTNYWIVDLTTGKYVLTFDSILSANFDAGSEICTVPIETGFKTTEYKYLTPNNITLRGVISRGATTSELITGFFTKTKSELIRETKQQLDKYVKYIIPLEIHIKSGLYERYQLRSYSIQETVDNFSLFEVEMDFEEILLAKDEETRLKNSYDKKTVNIGITQKTSL